MARATAFNHRTVGAFFDNLARVMDKHKFESHDIYNVDETVCMAVQNPGKVVAEQGTKQVGSFISVERSHSNNFF